MSKSNNFNQLKLKGLTLRIYLNLKIYQLLKLTFKLIQKLSFFKKFTFLYKIIKYILKFYSINLMDPFYMNKFYLFGMLITSILTLDSLLDFILYYYFKKNKDIVISNKLPKIIYDYLYKFKIICEIDGFSPRYFIVNSLMYFMLLLLLIIMYMIV